MLCPTFGAQFKTPKNKTPWTGIMEETSKVSDVYKISGKLPHSDLAADLEGCRRFDAVELAEGVDGRTVVDGQ